MDLGLIWSILTFDALWGYICGVHTLKEGCRCYYWYCGVHTLPYNKCYFCLPRALWGKYLISKVFLFLQVLVGTYSIKMNTNALPLSTNLSLMFIVLLKGYKKITYLCPSATHFGS